MADKGWEADARHRAGRVSKEYRMLLLEEGEEETREVVNEQGGRVTTVVRKGMPSDQGDSAVGSGLDHRHLDS